MSRYALIDRSELPANLRWDVPRRNQGQTVEVAYAHQTPKTRSEADDGDHYKRVTDHSDRSVTYYRLTQETK